MQQQQQMCSTPTRNNMRMLIKHSQLQLEFHSAYVGMLHIFNVIFVYVWNNYFVGIFVELGIHERLYDFLLVTCDVSERSYV